MLKKSRAILTHAEKTAYEMLDEVSEGIYLVDGERRILFWNSGAERITGFRKKEIEGRFCHDDLLQHIDGQGTSLCLGHCSLQGSIADGKCRQAEIILHHRNGFRVAVQVRTIPVRGAKDRIVGAWEVFSEVHSPQEMEKRLRELETLSFIDGLTGLPNRRLLDKSLQQGIEEMNRYGWLFGLLFFDIDHFKKINDRFGHAAGDAVLATIGQDFIRNTRASDMIGRWGGEEFVAVVRNVDSDQLLQIAEKFRVIISSSTIPDFPEIRVTVSIGGLVAKKDDTAENILAQADRCLYISKNSGRNRVTIQS